MTFATGARHGLSYIAEETFGTTPSSPDMTTFRHTACSLGLRKTTLETAEIRSDRQISHLLHGQKTVAGDIDFELSYGAFDDILAALMQSDWSSDVLKAGASQPSFTFERGFTDIGQYQILTGCVMDRLRFSVRPDRLVSGKLSVLGKSSTLASSSLDASPTAAASNDPMDSFSGSLTEGGAAMGIVAGLDLVIDNGLEQAFVIGDAEAEALLAGSSRITGEIVTYFEDAGLLEKFVDRSESSLTITFSGAGGSLAFELPRIVYTGAENPALGAGPITLSLPFTALYDETQATNLKITRTAP
ncbi:phage tail tube protein [uncultured Sneathiella sp.]|jgi:hypothetical protein|uniref:phage tail tube protein n=1 Tax=uncultured Sneathiella sp. TaxID=879315 RepID=UPI0030DC01ED|tara:strand:+ start:1904 stop:2809 length:906 start_codon:yes stop_codon:yes gene_type:complete